jgi:hypothetical protein
VAPDASRLAAQAEKLRLKRGSEMTEQRGIAEAAGSRHRPLRQKPFANALPVAVGFTDPVWPTKIVTAKIEVLGLDSASESK